MSADTLAAAFAFADNAQPVVPTMFRTHDFPPALFTPAPLIMPVDLLAPPPYHPDIIAALAAVRNVAPSQTSSVTSLDTAPGFDFDFPTLAPPPPTVAMALSPCVKSEPQPPPSRTRRVRGKRARAPASSGVCVTCGKCFFKSGALGQHVRQAHPTLAAPPSRGTTPPNTERLDCPRCTKTFSQQGSLNRHLRSIHEARKLHCRYCPLAFGQAFDLKRHQRRKHPAEEPAIPREALRERRWAPAHC